uniref:Uncharacterized protein n=1 Tax=Rhizophora mucronata TaxID=61149 RepID=A0A2P2J337_RHIMU
MEELFYSFRLQPSPTKIMTKESEYMEVQII